MKKFLLPLFAVLLSTSSAMADDPEYGTTPETAIPFPEEGWTTGPLADLPEEVWFTYTNTLDKPVNWGTAPYDWNDPNPAPQQIFAYLCDGGQPALQMFEGTDSYIILPGQEVLVKITPKFEGTFCESMFGMPAANPLPDSMKGRKYYPFDRTENDDMDSPAYKAQVNKQEPGTTVYYLYDFPYASQINAQPGFTEETNIATDLTSIEAIHIQCPGGTNIGNGIVQPYVKAGKNIIGVTTSDQATATVEFNIGLNAMATLNCSNNLLRGQSMVLDQNETYPDAYYTVDRFFEVPEDGTYTFINHGAAGTILNVGSVIRTDPENQYKYECNIENVKTATVGNNDAEVVVDDLKKGDLVLVQSDAFGIIGAGMENQPYLKVVAGDQSGIAEATADGNTLSVAVANGVLSVESVLLASGAEVAVYDMTAKKVASVVAEKGAVSIETALTVPAGVYIVVVYGKGNSESAKIVVE